MKALFEHLGAVASVITILSSIINFIKFAISKLPH